MAHPSCKEMENCSSTICLGQESKISGNIRRVLIEYKLAATAKSLQLCPTLCDPIDSSPPGSAIPGILQARTLEWVAISFPIAWKWKVKAKSPSRIQLVATPWTAAYQAPPPMGFSRQEYWSGLPLPSPEYKLTLLHIVVQSLSGICLFATPRTAACQGPSLLHYFPEFPQIHVYWVSDAI